MWPLFTNALRLFLKGKLFRDPASVPQRWMVGFAAALVQHHRGGPEVDALPQSAR